MADGGIKIGDPCLAMDLLSWPRAITNTSVAQMMRALNQGCWCGSERARLVRRIIRSGTVQITMQCQGCGRQIGTVMSATDHPGRHDYAEWDNDLVSRWDAKEEAASQARRAEWNARIAASKAEREQRIAERSRYREWCQTSPEWHRISERVLVQCRRVCQACLNARAEVVHHRTYKFGKLPPAWHLEGVCHACHDRLHADKRGETDEWCSAPNVVPAER